MELMLNGVNLSLVTFAPGSGCGVGAVLVFTDLASSRPPRSRLASPIVLLLVRRRRTLDVDRYADLRRATRGHALAHRPAAARRLFLLKHGLAGDRLSGHSVRQALRHRRRLRAADLAFLVAPPGAPVELKAGATCRCKEVVFTWATIAASVRIRSTSTA